jgi:hypothetical protein
MPAPIPLLDTKTTEIPNEEQSAKSSAIDTNTTNTYRYMSLVCMYVILL